MSQHAGQRVPLRSGGAVALAQLLELPNHLVLAAQLGRLRDGGSGDLDHYHRTAQNKRAQRRCEGIAVLVSLSIAKALASWPVSESSTASVSVEP